MIKRRRIGCGSAAAAAGGTPMCGMVRVDVTRGHLFVPQKVERVRLVGFPTTLSTVVALSASPDGTRITTTAVDINIVVFLCSSACDGGLENRVQGIAMPLEAVVRSVAISGHDVRRFRARRITLAL